MKPEVSIARALAGKLTDTEHPRLDGRSDGVEQVCERPVARPLFGLAAGCAYPPGISGVRVDCRRWFRVRHRLCCAPTWRGAQALERINRLRRFIRFPDRTGPMRPGS